MIEKFNIGDLMYDHVIRDNNNNNNNNDTKSKTL